MSIIMVIDIINKYNKNTSGKLMFFGMLIHMNIDEKSVF